MARVNVYVPLELQFIEIRILAHFLAPACFVIEVDKLLAFIAFLEPGVVFLMEHPVLLLQLCGRKVLLVSTLLEVEGKEE